MATYSWTVDIWKGVTGDGVSVVFYGTDSWEVTIPSWTWTIYQPTTTFDLTGFQPFKIICSVLYEIKKTWPANATTQSAALYLWGIDWGWNTHWLRYYPFTINRPSLWTGQSYFTRNLQEFIVGAIDNTYSKYILNVSSLNGDAWGFNSSEFTISNLSSDTTQHEPWYMWVDGLNLCYTDSYWFKHKIAYDSNYVNNVWVDNKGYIWLDDSDLLRIYYVDENGAVRRTYPSIEWAWWWVNVWTSNKWYIWTETSGYNIGWLAFIWPNGDKRRLMNWPPAWYV